MRSEHGIGRKKGLSEDRNLVLVLAGCIYVPGHVFRDPDGIGPWMIGGFTAGASDTPGLDNNPSAVRNWLNY